MKSSKGNPSGFTMIEIIAVLSIIAIIATVVVVRITSLAASSQLKSTADIIRGHLRYAQTRAINTDVVWYLTFTSTSYTIATYPSSTNLQLPGGNSASNQAQENLPSGMTITPATVSFDSWGTPYTDAPPTSSPPATALNDPSGHMTLTLSYNGSTETIQIQNDTGFIP